MVASHLLWNDDHYLDGGAGWLSLQLFRKYRGDTQRDQRSVGIRRTVIGITGGAMTEILAMYQEAVHVPIQGADAESAFGHILGAHPVICWSLGILIRPGG